MIKSKLSRHGVMEDFKLTCQRFPCGECRTLCTISWTCSGARHKHLLTLYRPMYPPE